jgi:integrase
LTARSALRRVLPCIGELPVDTIDAIQLQRLRDQLTGRCAVNSVRASLAHLGTLFGWAVSQGFLAQNPLRAIEMPHRQELIEYLSRDEVAALLAHADHQAAGSPQARALRVCILFALHTGLRKGELFGLRWSDLALDGGRLMVARSFEALPKSGKPRHLRLPEVLIPILIDWRATCPPTAEDLVFPCPLRNRWRMAPHSGEMLGLPALIGKALRRPLKRPWHALRHTFASHYIMSGGNILALQKILGHSDIKMTLLYAHLAPDFLEDEMNRIRFLPAIR